MSYRGLILDFGGVLTTRMRLNGQAFEKSEGLQPGAYFAALELTGPECVFVDDHAQNLPPAEALGITTIHHTDPDETVRQLDALLDRLAA